MEEEVWLEIPMFNDYMVSNFGNVYSMRMGELLRPKTHRRGYLRVVLRSRYEIKEYYVHHLVAMCFFADYREGMQIKHLDDNLSNNHILNLMPIKRRRRQRDRPEFERGLRVRIVETGDIFNSVYACARHVDGDPSTIYKCLRGDRINHMGFQYEYIR